MLINQLINKKVIVTNLNYKLSSDIQCYANKIGIIKGIKKINENIFIYLVEFFNHNRIWLIQQEFQIHCY